MEIKIYLLPMFAMVLLSFLTSLIMLYRRVRSARRGEIDPRRFKTLSIGDAPPLVLQAERHFINLFEVPVLFYAVMLAAMALQFLNEKFYILSWVFVAFRLIQAIIHLWSNKVYYRMIAFLSGFTVIIIMWTLLILQNLQN